MANWFEQRCPAPTSSNAAFIPLSNGEKAIVSKQDRKRISSVPWYKSGGYAVHKHSKMHREVVGAKKGSGIVDHINGNPLDNRRCNLRTVSNAQSSANRGRNHARVEGAYKGVYRVGDKWRVKIKKHGKQQHVGYFDDEASAARAYDEAASASFGEYARLNFDSSDVKTRSNAMAHRVVVQEGYSLPFEGWGDFGAKRSKRRKKRGKGKSHKRAKGKTLKACRRKWKKKSDAFKHRRKYSAFIKKCMK